ISAELTADDIRKLDNFISDPPTEEEINTTLDKVYDILDNPEINRKENAIVKEGYNEVIEILLEDRLTYEGIEKLHDIRARAIAMLAVDYLNGKCPEYVLTGIPLHKSISDKIKIADK